jgi:predicted transcriptional regulator
MTQTEIKQEIHSRLDSTNDDSILEIVYDILANGIPISDTIRTNTILNQKIDRGLEDIKQGRLISDEQANREIEEWLNK